MFYNQPLALRFGSELNKYIDQKTGIEPYWDNLDIAVAWVRASGMAHLSGQLEQFLKQGGQLSVTVGVDLMSTTREGLQALLDLERHGKAETFVFHNETGSVFHPKLYLFRNEEEARLIVGSNNLTEAGLYTNVEAGLQVDTNVTADVIVQALDALASWKDASTKLAVRLDTAFLDELTNNGYILGEAAARAAYEKVAASGSKDTKKALFGSRGYAPPARPGAARPPATRAPVRTAAAAPATTPSATPGSGTVLLMRLRRASATERRTQTQIPLRLKNSFFSGVSSVRSAHTGHVHGINAASARGTVNTLKLEIPEMESYADPVARFEQQGGQIVYEVHDVGSPKGNQIMASLQRGRIDGTTQTTISDAARATWWRFI